MKFKKTGSVAALAVAAMVLSACSGGGAAPKDTGSATEGGTLTFASWQWQEPARGVQIWDAVSAYTKANPAAKMEKQEVTRADFEKTMSTQIGAGAGPDILIIPDPFMPTLAASGALEPLDGVLPADETKALRESNDNYKFKGKQLSLVWEAVPYALFWNKALTEAAGVTEAPKTVDDLVQAAKAVQDKTGKTGFVVRHQLNEEGPWWTDFSNWPFGYGGGWSDDGKLTINSADNIKAADALKQIYSSGAFGVGDDASTYRSKFAAGEIGYVIDNSSALLTMVANNTAVPSTGVDAAVLPFPGGSSAYAGFSIGINAHSKNKALAKDFIKWMYSEKTQLSLADALFPSGIGTEATAPKAKVDANPWIKAFYEQLKDSQSVVVKGFEAKTPQISHIVLTQIQRMLTTDISAKDALDAAQKEAEALG